MLVGFEVLTAAIVVAIIAIGIASGLSLGGR